jgi:hypothetical protein
VSFNLLTCSPLFQLPWVEVKKEMTGEKGLDPAIADKIGEYVKHKGAFPITNRDPFVQCV